MELIGKLAGKRSPVRIRYSPPSKKASKRLEAFLFFHNKYYANPFQGTDL